MSPEIILELVGGYLRPLKVEDVHSGYVDGLNDSEVNRYLEVRHSVQTMQSVIEFVLLNLQQDNAVLFGVWQDGAERHCGTVRLHGIDQGQGTAHIGVCLFDKSAWGNKLGFKAVCKVTQWAFATLNLGQIEAGAYSENVASQKTFLAAGYEWIYDISDKFMLEGKPTRVKVYAARNSFA